jgi:hypothetical protein
MMAEALAKLSVTELPEPPDPAVNTLSDGGWPSAPAPPRPARLNAVTFDGTVT